eukprot:15335321-Ditylum_brightwellii.AAC.1
MACADGSMITIVGRDNIVPPSKKSNAKTKETLISQEEEFMNTQETTFNTQENDEEVHLGPSASLSSLTPANTQEENEVMSPLKKGRLVKKSTNENGDDDDDDIFDDDLGEKEKEEKQSGTGNRFVADEAEEADDEDENAKTQETFSTQENEQDKKDDELIASMENPDSMQLEDVQYDITQDDDHYDENAESPPYRSINLPEPQPAFAPSSTPLVSEQ